MAYFRGDGPIGASLRDYGEWAQLELEFLFRFLGAGDTVLDVGANVGTHSLAFARVVGDRGRVLSFEPQQEVFGLLKHNVTTNGLDNVMLYRLALGADPSVRYVPRVDYASQVNVGAISMLTEPSEHSDAVDVMPIDALSLAEVRLIKIDVEGMEPEAIRGAADTLRRCRPFLFIECNSIAAGAEILASLNDAGYVHFFKCSAAFNPGNYRGNQSNCFGPSRESGVFCVPMELAASVRAICNEAQELFAIANVEDLAFQFLRTPRYGDKTYNEREVALAPTPAVRLTLEPDDLARRHEAELKRLEYRIAKQAIELATAEARLVLLTELAAAAKRGDSLHAFPDVAPEGSYGSSDEWQRSLAVLVTELERRREGIAWLEARLLAAEASLVALETQLGAAASCNSDFEIRYQALEAELCRARELAGALELRVSEFPAITVSNASRESVQPSAKNDGT